MSVARLKAAPVIKNGKPSPRLNIAKRRAPWTAVALSLARNRMLARIGPTQGNPAGAETDAHHGAAKIAPTLVSLCADRSPAARYTLTH